MPTPTYDLISTNTLASSSTSVSISSIPSTYRDVVFVIDGTTTGTGPYSIGLTTNQNTGNYYYVYANGNGSTAASSGPGDNRIQIPGRDNYWSNSYRTVVVGSVLDYAVTNKSKTMLIRSGTGTVTTELLVGGEPATGAITSLTFTIGGSASQFAAGSTFSLYGIVG